MLNEGNSNGRGIVQKKEPGVLYYVRLSAIACMATRLIPRVVSSGHQKSFGVSCRSGGGRVMFRGTRPQGQAGEKGFASACSRISATCHFGTSSSTLFFFFRDLRLSDDFHVVSSSCFYGSDLLMFLNGVHAHQILV